MNTELQLLQRVLTASVKRKGEVPLTNLHLLNIVNMTLRVSQRQEDDNEKFLDACYNEAMEGTKP